MTMRLFVLCALAGTALAGDMPFAGKWKVNLAKSDFGQITVTIEKLPGGEWQSSAFGITAKYKMDGKDYPDGMGGTVSWKAVDANTWETVEKANGKVTETDTFKLSADGKTLTQVSKTIKADGGSIDSTTAFSRASAGTGLASKWRTRKVSGGSGTVEYAASGSDGLIYKDLDQGMTCEAKLDGKDYPCAGPMVPPGFTVAMKSSGRTLDFTVKKDGKPFFTASATVAADGKSMTEIVVPAAGGDKYKVVYDRM